LFKNRRTRVPAKTSSQTTLVDGGKDERFPRCLSFAELQKEMEKMFTFVLS
jgi:hypothetical protein